MAIAHIHADPASGAAFSVVAEIPGGKSSLEFAGGPQDVGGGSGAIVSGTHPAVSPAKHVGLSNELVPRLDGRMNFGWRGGGTCGFALMKGGCFSGDKAVLVASGTRAGGHPQKAAKEQEAEGCLIHPV